jgi:hypothetical protein
MLSIIMINNHIIPVKAVDLSGIFWDIRVGGFNKTERPHILVLGQVGDDTEVRKRLGHNRLPQSGIPDFAMTEKR